MHVWIEKIEILVVSLPPKHKQLEKDTKSIYRYGAYERLKGR